MVFFRWASSAQYCVISHGGFKQNSSILQQAVHDPIAFHNFDTYPTKHFYLYALRTMASFCIPFYEQ